MQAGAPGGLQGPDGLGDEHVHHGRLERGAQVGEPRPRGRRPLPLEVDRHRGLEPGEREVEAVVEHGPGEGDRRRVALGGEAVDDGTTRIAEAEELGDLVVGLARRVVPGRPQDPVAPEPRHVHEFGVAAGDQQRHVGDGRAAVVVVVCEEHREQVALHVVDPVEGQPRRQRQAAGRLDPDEQGAHQAGPVGHRQGVEVRKVEAGLVERPAHHRHHRAQVGAAGKLRHDAAEGAVDLDLARDHAGEHPPPLADGGGRFVAGTLEGEDPGRGHGGSLSERRPAGTAGCAGQRSPSRRSRVRRMLSA